jgi:ABC-type lipoprotein export system ATPase subunit
MISFVNVGKNYYLDDKTVISPVHDTTLNVNAGEFILISGRSGSGKTTLLNLVAGLVRPTMGKVLIDNFDLQKMTDKQLTSFRCQNIGFVFQFPSLLPTLSVLDNVIVPTMFDLRDGKHDEHERATELLKMLGLSEKKKVYPRQLSAGEQKRVVIARSLINCPRLILADEPTSDLDEKTEREIMAIFRTMHVEGKTVIMVTHNLELVSYATRAFKMENGTLTEIIGKVGQ